MTGGRFWMVLDLLCGVGGWVQRGEEGYRRGQGGDSCDKEEAVAQLAVHCRQWRV
jgi:hypothetical protein